MNIVYFFIRQIIKFLVNCNEDIYNIHYEYIHHNDIMYKKEKLQMFVLPNK